VDTVSEFIVCAETGLQSEDRIGNDLLDLLEAHRPLLAASIRWAKAAGLLRHQHQWDDAWQAGRLGFLEAHARYDASNGASVGTYARQYVLGAVREALEGDARFEHMTVPIDPAAEDADGEEGAPQDVLRGESGPTLRIEAEQIEAAIQTFLRSLPERQRSIVKKVFWEDCSQADVSRDLGVSRKTITKTLQKVYARGRQVLGQYQVPWIDGEARAPGAAARAIPN
jgi:RNA polymerase sigma factor (sigma-70 family)